MKCSLPISLLCVLLLLISSCTSSSVYRDVYPALVDGRYDSEFPYRGCSEQLEEIVSTVKRINVMTHYRTYDFSIEDSVVAGDPHGLNDLIQHRKPLFLHNTFGGTGTILLSDEWRIALITCAHVIDSPDTIINFYGSPEHDPARFVRNISIKTGQSIFLGEVSPSASFDVIAIDRSLDLAIIGQQRAVPEPPRFKAFAFPLGKAKELEWGSFVYIFGYPSGSRMISKGIVSPTTKLPPGSFNVDVVISEGSSGSIALAVRDGVPHFELVGILKAVPARISRVLAPANQAGEVEADDRTPYHGDIFVERKIEMQPGIAQAIPVESMFTFILDHQNDLKRKGYDLSAWTNPTRNNRSIQ